MFCLGVIEESLGSPAVLIRLEPFLFRQRTEKIPGDPSPVWHINEYHVPDDSMAEVVYALEKEIKNGMVCPCL